MLTLSERLAKVAPTELKLSGYLHGITVAIKIYYLMV
jgi:hypothetical protein